MDITDVRIKPLELRDSRMRAVASITIDNCFAVHDIKIIERSEGEYLVFMPSRTGDDGVRRDTAHPINRETRKMIEDMVISRYKTQKERTEKGAGGQG